MPRQPNGHAKPDGVKSSSHIGFGLMFSPDPAREYAPWVKRGAGVAGSLHRRTILAAGLALPARRIGAVVRSRDVRMALLGQCLIQQDLRQAAWPGRAAIAALLKPAERHAAPRPA